MIKPTLDNMRELAEMVVQAMPREALESIVYDDLIRSYENDLGLMQEDYDNLSDYNKELFEVNNDS